MESQRVKTLTEGYLRGWLNFEYPYDTSYAREEIIVHHLENELMYSLLANRLFIETTIRSNVENKKKGIFDPVFDVAKTMIELKLPSVAPKDKIEKNSLGMTAAEMDEWKQLLKKMNKNK